MNPGLALGVKDTKDLKKILKCLFPNPPFDPSLSKEEIKKAVKEFEDKKNDKQQLSK